MFIILKKNINFFFLEKMKTEGFEPPTPNPQSPIPNKKFKNNIYNLKIII